MEDYLENTEEEKDEETLEIEEEDDSSEGISVLGETYTEEQLRELLEAGKNAKSFIASATQKAQEAAELKRQAEEAQQYAELGKALLEAYQNKGQEGVNEVVAAISTAIPRESGPGIDPSELTENEYALYQIIQQQQAQIAQMSQLYQQVAPKLTDLEGFYMTAKQREEASQIASSIKQTYGVDLPLEEINRMRESGISDPVKALGYMRTLVKGNPSPFVPSDRSNLVDESDMSADDIFLSRWRGNVG